MKDNQDNGTTQLTFESISSFVMTYKFLKEVGKSFKEFDAYDLGLIDDKGTRLKYAESDEEKEAMDSWTKLILNTKRLMSRFGIKSQSSQKIISLFLLKENTFSEKQLDRIVENLFEKSLDESTENDNYIEAVVLQEMNYFK